MYAIVRKNTFDSSKLAEGQRTVDEFNAVHAKQVGYRGSMTVDIGDGHWIVVNLWDTRESATAALPLMIPVVQRLLEPLMSEPSQLLGTGPVVMIDIR